MPLGSSSCSSVSCCSDCMPAARQCRKVQHIRHPPGRPIRTALHKQSFQSMHAIDSAETPGIQGRLVGKAHCAYCAKRYILGHQFWRRRSSGNLPVPARCRSQHNNKVARQRFNMSAVSKTRKVSAFAMMHAPRSGRRCGHAFGAWHGGARPPCAGHDESRSLAALPRYRRFAMVSSLPSSTKS